MFLVTISKSSLLYFVFKPNGRYGRRPYTMTLAKPCLTQAAMERSERGVGGLSAQMGITRQAHYRHVDPKGRLPPNGEKLRRQVHVGREQGQLADMHGNTAGEEHA
jgi:hypothetical protein